MAGMLMLLLMAAAPLLVDDAARLRWLLLLPCRVESAPLRRHLLAAMLRRLLPGVRTASSSYFIYELTSSNVFPLSAKEGDQTAPSLQHVLWAPRQPTGDSASNGEKGTMQGIAFVQEGDIYYKPKVQSDLICRITTNDDGNHLRKKLAELAKPQIMTFSVEIKYDFNAQVKLFLPPGIKEDDDMLLPLILHVDATPESQLVSEKYSFDWNWYLCSYQSYIIAQIDARGSGYQGEALKTQIRGKVGIEVEDQLSVLTAASSGQGMVSLEELEHFPGMLPLRKLENVTNSEPVQYCFQRPGQRSA
ncbi:dipeptidyl-peptidase [Culex quinquefasciatus]|uniref:Dipeptidyl-peptidase n=1 Tax=Culex quinquefasciatus TaxID=7176 RepID=B0X8I8_CULQU|nr:dipeptidyl-peptidase [Culex quinquefasciatus]|eukprot:XP_001865969.1 dipeptidyl-peptidase [Culex quinquefasciatus]